jgi:putative flippase GtrA
LVSRWTSAVEGWAPQGVTSGAMKNALDRLWRFCHTPQGLKVVRYTMVSMISALTSLVILTIVYGVLRLWSEVVSTLFANIMAGFPSYYLNRRWVWRKGGRSHVWRELLPFWVMSITGIGFALYTASLAHNFADAHHLQHLARTVLVVGANIAAFGILWFLKFLILNRLFAEIADAEVGVETDSIYAGSGSAEGSPSDQSPRDAV